MSKPARVKSYTGFAISKDDRIRFKERFWALKDDVRDETVRAWPDGYVLHTIDDLEYVVEAFTFEDIDFYVNRKELECERGYFSARAAIARRKNVRIFDLPAATIMRARMVAEYLEAEYAKSENGEYVSRSKSGYAKFIERFKSENADFIPAKTGKREVIPGPRQFGRLVQRFEENQLEPTSLAPRHRGGVGQRVARYTAEEHQFHAEYAVKYQSKDRPTKVDCYQQMIFANKVRKRDGLSQFAVPSLRTFQRMIDDLGDFRNEVARAGDPLRVIRKVAISRRGLQPDRLLQVVEMDEHKLDLVRLLTRSGIWDYLHPEVQQRLEEKLSETNDGRVWLSVAMDACSRSICGAKLLWGAPDGGSAVATLAMVARPKDFEAKAHGTLTPWIQGGTAEVVHTDAGASYTSLEFQQAVMSYTGKASIPPSKHPHLRGRVERFFRTINQRYIHLLSGQTFANVVLRDNYDAQKHRHMTDEQLANFIVKIIVDVYHNTPHRGLGGLTPLQSWFAKSQYGKGVVRGYPSDQEYAEAFSIVTKYKIGNYGITILGLPYSNEWLQGIRKHRYHQELEVKINEIDISRILVKDPLSDEWMEVKCSMDIGKGHRLIEWLGTVRYLRSRFGKFAKISSEVAQEALAAIRDEVKGSKDIAGIYSPYATPALLKYWNEEVVAGFTIVREADTDYGEHHSRPPTQTAEPDPSPRPLTRHVREVSQDEPVDLQPTEVAGHPREMEDKKSADVAAEEKDGAGARAADVPDTADSKRKPIRVERKKRDGE